MYQKENCSTSYSTCEGFSADMPVHTLSPPPRGDASHQLRCHLPQLLPPKTTDSFPATETSALLTPHRVDQHGWSPSRSPHLTWAKARL